METRRILCMEHCAKDLKVFSFDNVPGQCPICSKDLASEVLNMPPFLLPYPFRKSSDCPCSLVIKPSRGTFLRDYANSTDLHIGVTDSNGVTYEYDINGLTETPDRSLNVLEGTSCGSSSGWDECLPIFMNPQRRNPSTSSSSQPLCPLWKERWDAAIAAVVEESHWTKDRYNPESHNCFSFVLEFLRCLGVDEWSSYLRNKTSLCSAFILPVTTLAGKYISLYRQLLKKEYVILVSP